EVKSLQHKKIEGFRRNRRIQYRPWAVQPTAIACYADNHCLHPRPLAALPRISECSNPLVVPTKHWKFSTPYQAAAVGRLMMGELTSWQDFLEPDRTDWSTLPRRELNARRAHVRSSLMPEIEKFCQRNFVGMTSNVLRQLYQDVRAERGLECAR